MKSKEVKDFFERTDVYLTYNYNLRIRRETVAEFIADEVFDSVLDMPCGTGDITVPLLSQFRQILFMDFSTNMVKLTESRIPKEDMHKVTLVNADFNSYDFKRKQFDLIISLGILAHIENPENFLKEIAALVKPGGKLIIQNTNSKHWFSKLIRTYLGFRRVIGKDKYRLNKIPEDLLINSLKKEGFHLLRSFKYNQSFLGFSRIFSNDLKYKLTRNYFGHAANNTHSGQGSDGTFLFVKSGK